MSVDAVEEANRILRERGYRQGQLHVHVAPLPGRVLLKGSKIVSPFADGPDTVLSVVRGCVPPIAELGEAALTPRALRAWLGQSGGDSSA